jgi:acetyl esterase
MAELDPKVRTLLDLMAQMGDPPLSETTPQDLRERRARGRDLVNAPTEPIPVVRDVVVAGAAGSLKARLYDIEDGLERPTLVYFHGGGFVFGDLESHDPLCRRLAHDGRMRVIAVDYRLAPEAPFPAAVDDAIAAFADIATHPERFGADPARLAVGGDSAGANLAINVARASARAGRADVAFQLLIYPVTQQGADTPSRTEFADGYFLTREGIDWFQRYYLGDTFDLNDPRISPLNAEVPRGTAPALVITAGFDPLVDEGKAYADKLTASGVPTAYVDYPRQVHGFVSFTAFSEDAIEAIAHAARAVRSALG